MVVRGLLVLVPCVWLVPGIPAAAAVRTSAETVGVGTRFVEAVDPGAITRVCAPTEDELRAAFAERGAPFEPGLVRRRRGRRCHVHYTPTIPGFQAEPEDRRVRELLMNVDGVSLLSMRERVFGDSLDISKALVARLPRGLPVTLGTRLDLPERFFDRAMAFHYGERADQVDWRRAAVGGLSHPWAQDYLKSGHVGEETRILVTRRLFEGRREDGELFRPLLDSMSEGRFVRSRLSWEGGDLQFIQHPRDLARLILLFGDSAKAYWGEELTPEEYAYVLKREFGADIAVDLSGLVPHVDYFVAFLPAAGIALVSQPVTGRLDLALAAAATLEERFEGAPPPTLVELRQHLEQVDSLSGARRELEKLLKRARSEARAGWPRVEDPRLGVRMASHVAARCPASPADCFSDAALESFLESDPVLLRDWSEAALAQRTDSAIDLRLLSVVESQLTPRPPESQKRIDAAVATLEELGFRVVPVPRLGGDQDLEVPWSGISYVNSLLVDRTLFVPRFGLGEAEDAIFSALAAALPPEYDVVPVYARHLLLYNGGVHCTVGIVRD